MPSEAVILDLTGSINDTGTINNAILRPDNTNPAGSGIFVKDTGGVFLRIQEVGAAKDLDGMEEGFNTDTNGVMDNVNGVHTRDILYSSLNLVTINEALYIPFLLDINEDASSGHLLTLENVSIFSSTTGGLSHGSLLDLANDASTTLLWDMDGGTLDGDSSVILDYNLVDGGSGHVDMGLFVPLTEFGGVNPGDHIILYSKFSGAEAGFEEWTPGAGAGPGDDPEGPGVPEPSTAMLGVLGLVLILRRRLR